MSSHGSQAAASQAAASQAGSAQPSVAGAVPPQVNVPGPPPAVLFALTPADTPGVLDYSTRQGIEIYRSATRSLYTDPADNFPVEASGLQTFLALLQQRGNTCSWDFDVPQDVANPLVDLSNFLTNHGRFTLEHLVMFCATFIFLPCRAAQMNMQMVKCILASLSLPGFRKVQTWHEQWHNNGMPVALQLIKIIIREAYIDTQATTRILREHLSSLPEKLLELKGDITQLNAYVKVTQDQLAARGETTTDLLANLFKGYLACADKTFRSNIEKKQEDYDEGTVYTVEELMSLANNKYKTLIENGKWMAPSPEEEKIMALEAKLAKMSNPKKPSNQQGNTGGQNNSTTSSSNTPTPLERRMERSRRRRKIFPSGCSSSLVLLSLLLDFQKLLKERNTTGASTTTALLFTSQLIAALTQPIRARPVTTATKLKLLPLPPLLRSVFPLRLSWTNDGGAHGSLFFSAVGHYC